MVMVMNLYSAFPIDIFKCALQASDIWVRSDISVCRRRWQPLSVLQLSHPAHQWMKWSLTTTPGTICPTLCDKCVGPFTSHRIVWIVKGCETGPTVYSPYPRRLESLTICGCNYKGSTFSSVILRPWVLVRQESNSRPPTWQPDAQPAEPLVLASWYQFCSWKIVKHLN